MKNISEINNKRAIIRIILYYLLFESNKRILYLSRNQRESNRIIEDVKDNIPPVFEDFIISSFKHDIVTDGGSSLLSSFNLISLRGRYFDLIIIPEDIFNQDNFFLEFLPSIRHNSKIIVYKEI